MKLRGLNLLAVFILALMSVMGATHVSASSLISLVADSCGSSARTFVTAPGMITLTENGYCSSPNDALTVAAGDLLVFISNDFCFQGSSTTCDRIEPTGLTDSLGNTWTLVSPSGNYINYSSPRIMGQSVFTSVATHAGTESDTNGFTMTLDCGDCTGANADAARIEFWTYEYANAVGSSSVNHVTCVSSPCTSINAPITTHLSGSVVVGALFADPNAEPCFYTSSQTNQLPWFTSAGRMAGDEGPIKTIGPHNFSFSCTYPTGAITLISAEIDLRASPISPPLAANVAPLMVPIILVLGVGMWLPILRWIVLRRIRARSRA